MTACNIIIQGKCGYLISDTGWFWDDGRLAKIESKITALPSIKVALATRGVGLDLSTHLGKRRWRDLEELLAAFPSILPDLIKRMQRRYPARRGPQAWVSTVYLVGYLPAFGRAGGMVISNSTEGMPPGYQPLTWQPVQECLSPGVDLAALYGEEPNTADPYAFSIEAGALAILEAQRGDRWSSNGGATAHRVGGSAELTTVGPDGVRTQTLRTWPDTIEQKIRL